MRKYTQKELREYIRLKLARDLTTVDPEELPRHYEKIGYSRGIYGPVHQKHHKPPFPFRVGRWTI